MDITLRGGEDQPWISLGRTVRAHLRFSRKTTLLSLVANVALSGALAYVSVQPREVPVPVGQLANGLWQPAYKTVTPDQAGESALLANWATACWTGSSDQNSISARQCSALISNAPGDGVLAQIQSRDQEITAKGLVVTPIVRSVMVSGTSFVVDWDENIVDQQGAKSQRIMKAYGELAFSLSHRLLHGDPLTNPYGMFIRQLRLAEVSR